MRMAGGMCIFVFVCVCCVRVCKCVRDGGRMTPIVNAEDLEKQIC